MSKLNGWIVAAVAVVGLTAAANAQTVTKYVRYQAGNAISYGILDGDTIRELQGSIFESAKPTGRTRKLVGRHNGKVVQETNTNLLIFSIPYIVSYVSRYVTLEPGDVIFTGRRGRPTR